MKTQPIAFRVIVLNEVTDYLAAEERGPYDHNHYEMLWLLIRVIRESMLDCKKLGRTGRRRCPSAAEMIRQDLGRTETQFRLWTFKYQKSVYSGSLLSNRSEIMKVPFLNSSCASVYYTPYSVSLTLCMGTHCTGCSLRGWRKMDMPEKRLEKAEKQW